MAGEATTWQLASQSNRARVERDIGMTGAVLVAVVIAAAVVGAVMARRFGRTPAAGAERADQPWLVEAHSVIDEGRQLSEQVAGLVEGAAIEGGPGVESADPSAGLDRLTRRLAALSATAPTVMDVRVCRSVAVQSRALSDVLRSRQGSDPTTPSHRHGAVPCVVDDHRHEFDAALRDLADHVELL